MTLTYFNDINVYFHMKNHYKMLKQVKSVIDTSIPQSLLKSPLAMHSLQKRWKGNTNEALRKIYNSPIYMSKRGGPVKRHNCLNSEAKSEVSLRTGNNPSRPATRRNSIITPKENLAPRSCSVGPPIKNEKMFKFRQKKRPSVSSTRSSNTENQSNLQLDLEKENAIKAPSESAQSTKISACSRNSTNSESAEQTSKASDNNFFKESSEEHEYLLFLLRITEDIIVNDFYSNNDIKQVFKFHIDANKHRLTVKKMQFHIGNLCNELNIDCKEYQNESTQKNEKETALKFTNSPTSRSCYLNNEAFLNCLDCSAIRTSSLYKMASLSQIIADVTDGGNGDNESSRSPSLLRLLEKLSLGRVTECTEPAPSTSTMNSPNGFFPCDWDKDKETEICDNKEESPIDFETFVKELYSTEDNWVPQNPDNTIKNVNQNNEIIALESPPIEINTTLIRNESQENTDLLEKRSSKILPGNFLSKLKLSSKDSKSEIEISEKETKSLINSDKFESDFEKSSSYHSFSKSDEEKVRNDENTSEKNNETIQNDHATVLNETLNNNTVAVQSDKIIASNETLERNTKAIQSEKVIASNETLERNTKAIQSEQVIASNEILEMNTNNPIQSNKVIASNDSLGNNSKIIQSEKVIALENNINTIQSDKATDSSETLEMNTTNIQSDKVINFNETLENNTRAIQSEEVIASHETLEKNPTVIQSDKVIASNKTLQRNVKTIQSDKIIAPNETLENNAKAIQSKKVRDLNETTTIQSDKDTALNETMKNNPKVLQSEKVIALNETLKRNTKTIQSNKVIALNDTLERNTKAIQSENVIASNEPLQRNIKAIQSDKVISSNKTLERKSKPIQSNKITSPKKTFDRNIDTIQSTKVTDSNQLANEKLESSREFHNINSLLVNESQSLANNFPKKKPTHNMSPIKLMESKNKDNKSLLGISTVKTLKCESLSNTSKISKNTIKSDKPQVEIISNISLNHQLQNKGINSVENEIIYNRTDLAGQSLLTTNTSNKLSPKHDQHVKVTQPKTKSIFSLESSNNDNRFSNRPKQQIESKKSSDSSESQDREDQDTILKVVLQGTLDDSDYVMIKGPVYVYKPLLESEPKLVFFNNEHNGKSRPNSTDSQRSNRTFTVVNSPVRERLDADQQVDDLLIDSVDEAIQFDQSLHSLVEDSMENILELTRRAYNQFADSKLLHADYDLTPQKDLDHKYHHLMLDVTTSVSGVNIKESLLLNDDYLVENDENQQNLHMEQHVPNVETKEDFRKGAKDDQMSIKDIDSYLKIEPKLFDDMYITRNRKLIGSASMPKLMMKNDSSRETLDGRDGNEFRNGELLIGYTNDLMNFDMPSQDSSLRSDGETYQNEKPNRGLPWNTYYN